MKTPMKTPTLERAHPAGMGGVQKLYRYPNNYGASVVRHPYSYGWSDMLWELAVIRWPSAHSEIDEFYIDYESGITDNVLGPLSDDEVDETLTRIEALPNVIGKPNYTLYRMDDGEIIISINAIKTDLADLASAIEEIKTNVQELKRITHME